MRGPPIYVVLLLFCACRTRDGGLEQDADLVVPPDANVPVDTLTGEPETAPEVGEPPGITSAPDIAGCSDGSREGFRDFGTWPMIAGCAGAFDQPGVLGAMAERRTCNSLAGNGNSNSLGKNCSVADLCAPSWHVCRGPADVFLHSPGGCESCVLPGELRFFVAAGGASVMGICTADAQVANDIHGCGGLGEPEDATCAPMSRRMGFADCAATGSVWTCGGAGDSLQEALLVRKSGPVQGGVLCCKGD